MHNINKGSIDPNLWPLVDALEEHMSFHKAPGSDGGDGLKMVQIAFKIPIQNEHI